MEQLCRLPLRKEQLVRFGSLKVARCKIRAANTGSRIIYEPFYVAD